MSAPAATAAWGPTPAPEAAPPRPVGHPTKHPPAERRAARLAVLAALGAGAGADLLLRGAPLGINLALWTALALAALFGVARARGRPVTVGAGVLAALALAFAACAAWRDAAALVALDLLALGTVACALARALRHGAAWAVEHAGLGAYAAGAAAVAGDVLAGARALAADHAALGELRGAHRARGVVVAIRGAALAAPVLGVFALLLASADGAFSHLLGRAFAVDLGAATAHGLWTLAGAWAAAGFAAGALFADPEPAHGAARPPGWVDRVGGAEVCVALALVDALFLAFVVVQLGWLFGGRAVAGGPGVTYAAYARRGFFELAAVAALTLPLLTASHGLVRRGAARGAADARVRRAFRAAAGLLVALVGVMIASAADRMRLYQAAYGLTELRFYVSAFMAWLLAVFAWAAATLLRDRPAPFALGTLALAWAWVAGLNAANPAAWVVRVDAARAAAGLPFDPDYLASLGADAVPALVRDAAPAVARRGDPSARCALARALGRADAGAAHGWRGWNASRRAAARAAVAEGAAARVARWAACTPPTPPVSPPAAPGTSGPEPGGG